MTTMHETNQTNQSNQSNDNDGFTVLEDGTEIESPANRVLFFDPLTLHASTSCTDQRCRWNIQVNYF